MSATVACMPMDRTSPSDQLPLVQAFRPELVRLTLETVQSECGAVLRIQTMLDAAGSALLQESTGYRAAVLMRRMWDEVRFYDGASVQAAMLDLALLSLDVANACECPLRPHEPAAPIVAAARTLRRYEPSTLETALVASLARDATLSAVEEMLGAAACIRGPRGCAQTSSR